MRWTSRAVVIASVAAVVFTGAGPAEAAPDGTICVPFMGCHDPSEGSQNVAKGAVVIGGGGVLCSLGSGPQNTVDGAASNIYTDKWCVRPSLLDLSDPYLTIPLVRNHYVGYDVFAIVVKHAGVAGEDPAYNTKAFRLRMTSVMKPGWEHVSTTTNNTANETVHKFSAGALSMHGARNITEVQLFVDVPTQGTNQATRIYEVEVWAKPDVA